MTKTQQPQLCICVGAQKAGTSWLFKCLEEHPAICAATGKETNFFLAENKKTEGYDTYFTHCSDREILFEASPLYLYDETIPSKIIEQYPTAKIIILLRDPVERTRSHYHHLKNKGQVDSQLPFEAAVEARPDLLEHSNYKKFVSLYQNTIPAEQLLLLDYQDIVDTPQNLIDRVCAFLEITPHVPKFLRVKYNTSAARANPLYNKATRWYLRLQRSFIGKKIVGLLKKSGLNSARLERTLAVTSNKNKLVDSLPETISARLRADRTFYHNYFPAKHSNNN